MDMHRAQNHPDWQPLDPADRNRWQTLAARTHSTVTPGNLISLAGLAAVGLGLGLAGTGHYGAGLAWLVGGRAADLADGWAAQITGTKSPLGEKIDASFDKLGTFATLIVLAATGIVPLWLAVAITLPQVVITVIALIAYRRGARLHPSRLGKLGMAAAWLCLPLFLAAKTLSSQLVAVLAVGLALVAAVLGVVSALRYGRDARGLKRPLF